MCVKMAKQTRLLWLLLLSFVIVGMMAIVMIVTV